MLHQDRRGKIWNIQSYPSDRAFNSTRDDQFPARRGRYNILPPRQWDGQTLGHQPRTGTHTKDVKPPYIPMHARGISKTKVRPFRWKHSHDRDNLVKPQRRNSKGRRGAFLSHAQTAQSETGSDALGRALSLDNSARIRSDFDFPELEDPPIYHLPYVPKSPRSTAPLETVQLFEYRPEDPFGKLNDDYENKLFTGTVCQGCGVSNTLVQGYASWLCPSCLASRERDPFSDDFI